MAKTSDFESKEIPVIHVVGKLYGRPSQHWPSNHPWRKRYALGGKYPNKKMGVYLFPVAFALLWPMVASVFLHVAKRNPGIFHLLYSK